MRLRNNIENMYKKGKIESFFTYLFTYVNSGSEFDLIIISAFFSYVEVPNYFGLVPKKFGRTKKLFGNK